VPANARVCASAHDFVTATDDELGTKTAFGREPQHIFPFFRRSCYSCAMTCRSYSFISIILITPSRLEFLSLEALSPT